MSIERVESLAALRALEPEWRALEPKLVDLPFVRFDWVDAWWRHLRKRTLGVRDDLWMRAFRSPSGELIAVAPLMITTRPGVGPFRIRQLQCFGADPNISEIRCVAAPADQQLAAYEALLDHVHSSSKSWDWCLLGGLPAELTQTILAARYAGMQWVRNIPSYCLTLPPTWGELRSRLPRNMKESLRKCYNSLKREALSFTFDVVTTRAETAGALDEFFALHRERANLNHTVRHPDVFQRQEAQRFLVDVCERFAERDTLRIFQLKVGGQVVATRIGFIVGNSLYLYYSGYLEAFSRYSVMTTTVAEAIKYAIAYGFRSVNLSTGSDRSKHRWRPSEILSREVEIVSPSARGRLSHGIFVHTRRAARGFGQ